MDRRDHAASAAAGEFNRRDRKLKKARVPFDFVTLLAGQSRRRPGRKDQQLFFLIMKLERVSGEICDLIAIEFDHRLATRFQALTNFFPVLPDR